MRQLFRNMAILGLLCSLLPLLGGCDNEDDVVSVFTGKTWKLCRLTVENSSAPFSQGIWSNETLYNASMEALAQENNFTITFDGVELNGEISGTSFTAHGIRSTLTGTWNADGKTREMHLFCDNPSNSESDPLANAFINALQNVYKYEGDVNNLTLFFKDGQVTKVLGFIHK